MFSFEGATHASFLLCCCTSVMGVGVPAPVCGCQPSVRARRSLRPYGVGPVLTCVWSPVPISEAPSVLAWWELRAQGTRTGTQ